MRIVDRSDQDYEHELARLAQRGDADLARVEPVVAEILAEVRERGDAALLSLTERLDGRRPEPLVHARAACRAALARINARARAAMELAARRVRALHQHQREASVRFS